MSVGAGAEPTLTRCGELKTGDDLTPCGQLTRLPAGSHITDAAADSDSFLYLRQFTAQCRVDRLLGQSASWELPSLQLILAAATLFAVGAVTIRLSNISKHFAGVYALSDVSVEFYTGEKAMLKNVPTWRCSEKDALAYVLEHLKELVVKEVHGSGGYGMLVGPAASKREIAAFRAKLEARPRNYIAQPTLALSTVPILTKAGLAPRHVDLRPYVLVSPGSIEITPGGLTRVALKKGSLVVNSSQGGGTKDTWVLEE